MLFFDAKLQKLDFIYPFMTKNSKRLPFTVKIKVPHFWWKPLTRINFFQSYDDSKTKQLRELVRSISCCSELPVENNDN